MKSLRSQAGFSLIELAVVLVIIGLLVGGGIAVLTTAAEQTRRVDAKRQLQYAREALYGFAMSQGRLPCPDTDYPPDGVEDFDAGIPDQCDQDGGAFPWVDLGLGRRDQWGSPIYYEVDMEFADTSTSPAFSLSDDGNISVNDGDGNPIVSNSPALLVVFGGQGSQVWTSTAYNCPTVGTNDFSADEVENCDGDDIFVDAEFRPPDATDGRFDDILLWIPLPVLKARMVDAGQLP